MELPTIEKTPYQLYIEKKCEGNRYPSIKEIFIEYVKNAEINGGTF